MKAVTIDVYKGQKSSEALIQMNNFLQLTLKPPNKNDEEFTGKRSEIQMMERESKLKLEEQSRQLIE